jgi:peptide/nickel transport system permease protein
MIPIITNTVLAIPFLLLGTLVLETFFSIPGLGDLIVRAIANNDRPVIISTTVFGTAAFILFNILSDVLYAVVDPRVQLK